MTDWADEIAKEKYLDWPSVAAALRKARSDALEEAEGCARLWSAKWDMEYRATYGGDQYKEGMSDGAHDVAEAIRALKTNAAAKSQDEA